MHPKRGQTYVMYVVTDGGFNEMVTVEDVVREVSTDGSWGFSMSVII